MSNKALINIENALYIVPTPIGNLADITLRALSVLQDVDIILCEDSRVTSRLLSHYEISEKRLFAYNDQSDEKLREKVLHFLQEGKSVALVSDAGTPLISDPGYKLIRFLRSYDKKIIPLPGASSAITALSASAIACDNFLFVGFLPEKSVARVELLKSLPKEYSVIFFESANRLLESLQDINQSLANRRICIARELTKLFEEIVTDSAANLIEFFSKNPDKIRGEIVLIIEKQDRKNKAQTDDQLIADIKASLASGISLKELSQNLADIYGIHKKEVYQLALALRN